MRSRVIPFQPSAAKRNATFRFRPRLYAELTLLPACGEPPRYVGGVSELQQLRADHAEEVLAFERANRAYFAASISDRGDAYFDRFAEGYRALLAEQESGECAFYLLVADDGSVLGRFNLYDLQDGAARVGYRVAEHASGRGVATATVRELCRVAATRHGLRTLRAVTAHTNPASSAVLRKAGFAPEGPAGPSDLGGKTGTWFVRDLTLLRPSA